MDLDIEMLALLKAMGGSGGGGSSVTVEPLTVTENGTTTAPEGTAYSPVTVNVPNPSTGTLSIYANGTYDVTEKAHVYVAVSPSFKVVTATKQLSAGKAMYAFGENVRNYAFAPVWDNNEQPGYVLDLNKSGPKVILNAGTENEQIENGRFSNAAFVFPTNLISYDDFPGKIFAIIPWA